MDIRSIKTPAPEVQNGEYLEKMFELQYVLMTNYMQIEGLPDYPIDINNKKGQVILKDFSARVTEELAEGYESTSLAIQILKKYGFNVDLIPDEQFNMLVNHLQNSNEEQADATAFYLELMAYAGITPSDIWDYINKNNLWAGRDSDALLETCMIIGVVLLNKSYDISLDIPARFPIFKQDHFSTPEKYWEVMSYIPGFNRISEVTHSDECMMLWDVCYHLGVARNYLKNKPWKQSGELTDEVPFISEVILGFLSYMGYLSYMGFTPESLYSLYWRKNQVNQFRIKSKY